MGALIAAGISGADPVDQVWHRRVALQGVYLITLDRRAVPLASAAPAHPPRLSRYFLTRPQLLTRR